MKLIITQLMPYKKQNENAAGNACSEAKQVNREIDRVTQNIAKTRKKVAFDHWHKVEPYLPGEKEKVTHPFVFDPKCFL
jgi:hypothetical protein